MIKENFSIKKLKKTLIICGFEVVSGAHGLVNVAEILKL